MNIKRSLYIISTIFLASIAIFGQDPAQCAQLKVTTLPSDFGSIGTIPVTRNITQNPNPDAPLVISTFIPNNATVANRVPVIFFSHGFGGIDYQVYEDMSLQLASNGYAVVFVPYSVPGTNASRYDQLWQGFQKAVQQYGNVLDTTRVGFAGHSYGGGATPEMARRGSAAGWGSNGLFIFTQAAWYSYGTNYDQIPATAKLVVQVYWEDEVNAHLISQNDIWNRLPQVTERRWQVIRPATLFCKLPAGHSIPTTTVSGSLNSLDYWGIWRRMHALAAYTFRGNAAAKDIAFGIDSYMGRWRAAPRPITVMQATDSPVINTTLNPTFEWPMRCSFADPGTPCP